jgi:hypothetical protein
MHGDRHRGLITPAGHVSLPSCAVKCAVGNGLGSAETRAGDRHAVSIATLATKDAPRMQVLLRVLGNIYFG